MSPASEDLTPRPVTLTWSGMRRGMTAVYPLLPGMMVFGVLCGVVAREAGLTFIENLLMNVFVFAGAAQLAAMEQWATPVPVVAAVVTTLLINLRFLLHGVAAQPWLRSVKPQVVYPTLGVVNDQSWTIAMVAYQRGERDAGFFVGANVLVVPFWVVAACAGYLLGTGIGDPARIGLDFSVTVIFAANLVAAWRGRSDAIPWLAAGGAALLSAWLIPGNWYVLIGGITGFVAGVLKAPPTPTVVSTSEPVR